MVVLMQVMDIKHSSEQESSCGDVVWHSATVFIVPVLGNV